MGGQEPRDLLVAGRPPLAHHPPSRVEHGQPRRPPPTPGQVHPDEPHRPPPPSDDADRAIRYPLEGRSFAVTEQVDTQAAGPSMAEPAGQRVLTEAVAV
jgi:hypothetical protein